MRLIPIASAHRTPNTATGHPARDRQNASVSANPNAAFAMACPLGKLNPGSVRTAISSSGRGRWNTIFATTFSRVAPATLLTRNHPCARPLARPISHAMASVTNGRMVTPPSTASSSAKRVSSGVRRCAYQFSTA